jgi:hypothetical protein
VVSIDANYDVDFSDMPRVMYRSGTRAWYGCMERAKGLTRFSKVSQGDLPLMGVNYRVDWAKSRIDFRHAAGSAFGYSHNVWEYMKYEEHNGYVWEMPDASYVYSKMPPT